MTPLTPSQRLRFYLYSGKNIAGCALALGGLALFFGGVIDAWWWAIVLGLYGAGAMGWPRSELADMAEHAQLSVESLNQHVRQLVAQVAKGLPKEAVDVLHSIESTLNELLPRLRELESRGVISAKDSFTVLETVRRYLPDTLAVYLRLPKLYAQRLALSDGRTAAKALIDQLTVMDSSLKEVAKSAYAGDAEALVTNGEFLRTKFTEKSLFLPL
jgi:hypothetical protein